MYIPVKVSLEYHINLDILFIMIVLLSNTLLKCLFVTYELVFAGDNNILCWKNMEKLLFKITGCWLQKSAHVLKKLLETIILQHANSVLELLQLDYGAISINQP